MTQQQMIASARQSATTAPKADPEVAKRAVADAKAQSRDHESSVQTVYKTQTDDIAGKNIHRDTDSPISEFDDPAANTYKDGYR